MDLAGIARSPEFVRDGGTPFFAWLHSDDAAPATDCVAVLCPPIGSEYTRSHRSIRHLADRLARAGVPALRFDYHGTGDSPGTDVDPARVSTWIGNIVAAARAARERSGRSRVVLVGVRLGATLAALASERVDPELLVLWNAPVKGRPYVREMQAIARLAAFESDADGALEAAGFVLTAETLADLRHIDLLQAPLRARRVLFVARDDLGADGSLAAKLDADGIANDLVVASGWGGMMADHQNTVVPEAALASIVEWVSRHAPPGKSETAAASLHPPQPGSDVLALEVDDEGQPARVEEVLCHFGDRGQLFGVLSRTDQRPTRPAIVLFNGGAVHHVGPNRLYVTLARSLAAMGFACLRFDLEGIGDSVLRRPGRENHPYPAHATADAKAALSYLRERFGYRRFIAVGLCSGAHTAFHSALQLEAEDIDEVVLINPYAFYYKEGMSLDVVNRLADTQQYKKSMRDPARWLKLLRGNVNLRRLLGVALRYPTTLGRSYLLALAEAFAPQFARPLARDLGRLFQKQRKVTVLLAEGEPGGAIIMADAKHTARRGVRAGFMRLETIAGGDHTFTPSRARQALVDRVLAHLKPWLAKRELVPR